MKVSDLHGRTEQRGRAHVWEVGAPSLHLDSAGSGGDRMGAPQGRPGKGFPLCHALHLPVRPSPGAGR